MLWRIGTLVAALMVIGFWLGRGTTSRGPAVSAPNAASKDAAAEAARVIGELVKLNPGFDGKGASWKVENDTLVEMSVDISAVTHLEPLQTVPTLKRLRLGRSSQAGVLESLAALRGLPLEWLEVHNAQISDLRPLQGMPLSWFVCQGSDVSDLSPLQGCPLQALGINGTDVSNLDPLRGMRIKFLNCGRTDVSNLAPLKGMPLTDLNVSRTRVSDLSPLQGMKLTRLICSQALIEDLSPIAGMPLKEIDCDFSARRDAEILRSIKTLEKINGSPAGAFWKAFPQ
jgi:Leucine-rich repeat (LRR) protein